MKNFDVKRPIPDQILESILDYPDEWEVKGESIYRHQSGLEIWAYKCVEDVKIYNPKMVYPFTLEDQRRILKAIKQSRAEVYSAQEEQHAKIIVKMLNTEPKKPLGGMDKWQWLIWAAIIAGMLITFVICLVNPLLWPFL